MIDVLNELPARIERAMGGDRHRFEAMLRRIEAAANEGRPHDRNLARLEAEVEASVERRAKREAARPRVTYPEDLPIAARRAEIAEAIRTRQVVVVAGETGSGKSTQLPKICLELGRGIDGLVGHTQPRRIAARSLARRVAEELQAPMGEQGPVGFKIRFTDTTSPRSYIKLMTDGILLAETSSDRELRAYDTLIIDEAHERSLNIDFLLGYLKQLLPKRPDLKVIITSATIDPQRFAEHFADSQGPAPVIEVSGRTYPVEVRYRPVGPETDAEHEIDAEAVQRGIADAVDELARDPGTPGDVLVFLPTERDIRDTAKTLRGRLGPRSSAEVLPLYSRLSTAEQDRVFHPTGDHRRIVLATNVAETSLTVPGIRYVVDTGTARIARYSARSGVQRLPIERVSQASADQRKGRCGRVAAGVCIRLFSEEDYAQRERFTPPEIVRTDLASVILQMKALGLGDIERFPFVEPPKASAIRDGYGTLYELRAVDEAGELTPLGRKLARLPVDPRVGRMILAADRENCLAEVLIIAAGLEAQDPRLRPVEAQQAADEAHAKFRVEGSDFLTLLNVWDFYHEQKEKLGRGALERACRQNFLSVTRMREWADVHRQLRDMTEEMGLRPRERRDVELMADPVHRSLLTGLLGNIAMRGEGFEYQGAGGKKLFLWPGSALFNDKPKWMVAAEHVETTRLYARTAAKINPSWIEPLAGHLVTRSISEPHWERKAGEVAAYEKLSLYGLTVVPRRRVHFGPLEPAAARELFIHHALVVGEVDWPRTPPFVKANAELIERLERVEAKARRRDILADEAARFAFYDRRIPPNVFDVPGFERWRRQAERGNAKLLVMTEEDLVRNAAQGVTQQAFPDALQTGTVKLPLEYHLEPGAEEDGVTVICPLPAVTQLDEARLEWLVPGLLKEKVTEMIRSLPKQVRKSFVPAPDWAEKVVERLKFAEGPLKPAVAKALRELSGVETPIDAFDDASLPTHLRMNVRVLDDKWNVVARGRDVAQVRRDVGVEAAASIAEVGDEKWKRDGITAWDFGDLPERVEVRRSGVTVPAFPAIVDSGKDVSLRLMDTPERADFETRRGMRRLFLIQVAREVRYQVESLPALHSLKLHLSTVMDAAPLRDQLIELAVDRAFVADQPVVRDPLSFEQRLNSGWNLLGEKADEVVKWAAQVALAVQQASLAIAGVPDAPPYRAALADVRSQWSRLVYPRFLVDTPWNWLVQYPRYLGGIVSRLRKLQNAGAPRDAQQQAQIAPLWRAFLERDAAHRKAGVFDPNLALYRWHLEEYRVSLFAQELGTSLPVSIKRLEKLWSAVRA